MTQSNHSFPPIPSASVILMRPDPKARAGFSIFLLERAGASSFMPGRYVFPGGRVERTDGPDPADMTTLKYCALRELWEEAGVVLAKGALPEAERLEEPRRALQKGQAGLASALAGLGLEPDLEALVPFARWITPAMRDQRFDATFFLASMPQGQKARSDHLETTRGLWAGPQEALDCNQEGRVGLAPPQIIILSQLARAGDLEKLLAAAYDLDPVEPHMWANHEARIVMLPHDPDYPASSPSHPSDLGRPCTADQATRLVNQDSFWLPYTAE
jgi:8-oxo-dGTP pyrophosphatase MutT (NUDIX family)